MVVLIFGSVMFSFKSKKKSALLSKKPETPKNSPSEATNSPKLIIIDLNGILLSRQGHTFEDNKLLLNPLTNAFLNVLSDSNIDYAFWTAATNDNAMNEWNAIKSFGNNSELKKEPIFIWSQSECKIA